jgi:riboflavin kinase / FMN adenylyltransferase
MELIHYKKIPASVKASVVSVGNFDGVHRGHELLIREVVKRGAAGRLTTVIVTFEPHTRSVVAPSGMQTVLSTLEEKRVLIERLGVEFLAWIPFDREFSELSSLDFVKTVLRDRLQAREWVMGEGHTFGKNHAGSKNVLQSAVDKNHITILPLSTLSLQDTVVSSTEIRKKIMDGGLEQAVELLGHPYLVIARRISGEKKGTQLGFPTLNFARPSVTKVLPPPGVYAAELAYREKTWRGAFYFGNCPTFSQRDFHCEFHEFGYTGEVPQEGEEARLWLHAMVRRDESFTGTGALTEQMKKDVTTIQHFFAGEGLCP